MQQQHFFQSFFGPGAQNGQMGPQIPEYILHNEAVLEIANNWPFARWMMDRYRNGELKQVDQIEQLWLNFIVQNNINIESYKNNEEFLKILWKIPEI